MSFCCLFNVWECKLFATFTIQSKKLSTTVNSNLCQISRKSSW